MRTWRVGIVMLALACSGGREEPSRPVVADSAAAEEPAGPGPWVDEIREGIRDLPSRAARDPVEARRAAFELYATRQEAIERRWGPRGTDAPDSTLARTVLEAETSFHELLALLNREAAPDSVSVGTAVAALDARLEAVLLAAGERP
jgi:hypothetical protein